MTQKEKDLLLKDLCARQPYGVNITIYGYGIHILKGIDGNTISTNRGINYPLRLVKPYLRPMSSMTEEEKLKYITLTHLNKDEHGNPYRELTVQSLDWLLSNHFDYRGLIEKGLALESPKGMYNV